MPLTCCICGARYFAVSPGTEAAATRFASEVVREITPADEEPVLAYCLDHWRQSWTAVPVRSDEEAEDRLQLDWLDMLRVSDAEQALKAEATFRHPESPEQLDLVDLVNGCS